MKNIIKTTLTIVTVGAAARLVRELNNIKSNQEMFRKAFNSIRLINDFEVKVYEFPNEIEHSYGANHFKKTFLKENLLNIRNNFAN